MFSANLPFPNTYQILRPSVHVTCREPRDTSSNYYLTGIFTHRDANENPSETEMRILLESGNVIRGKKVQVEIKNFANFSWAEPWGKFNETNSSCISQGERTFTETRTLVFDVVIRSRRLLIITLTQVVVASFWRFGNDNNTQCIVK